MLPSENQFALKGKPHRCRGTEVTDALTVDCCSERRGHGSGCCPGRELDDQDVSSGRWPRTKIRSYCRDQVAAPLRRPGIPHDQLAAALLHAMPDSVCLVSCARLPQDAQCTASNGEHHEKLNDVTPLYSAGGVHTFACEMLGSLCLPARDKLPADEARQCEGRAPPGHRARHVEKAASLRRCGGGGSLEQLHLPRARPFISASNLHGTCRDQSSVVRASQ